MLLIPAAPIGVAPIDTAAAARAADGFKALADPVRLRLLSVIAGCGDQGGCVCDLSSGFTVTGPTISHHLKVLRRSGLVVTDREGNRINYRADFAALNGLGRLLIHSTD